MFELDRKQRMRRSFAWAYGGMLLAWGVGGATFALSPRFANRFPHTAAHCTIFLPAQGFFAAGYFFCVLFLQQSLYFVLFASIFCRP